MRRLGGWSTLTIALAFSFGTAGVGSWLTDLGPWYYALKQPPWKPPDEAFGLIWSVIFLLLAVSASLAWTTARNWPAYRRRMLVLFGVNAIANIAWSALYFGLKRPDWAMAEWLLLWLSVVALVFGLWRISRPAALLNLPYLVWVSLAGWLNWTTIALNGPFG